MKDKSTLEDVAVLPSLVQACCACGPISLSHVPANVFQQLSKAKD